MFALIVGLAGTRSYRPVGTVGYGFSSDEKQAIIKQIHTRAYNRFSGSSRASAVRVKYMEHIERGNLRHATFRNFLFGRQPRKCRSA